MGTAVIPVHLKRSESPKPKDAIYYLVARNGLFLVRNNTLFSSVTREEAIPILAPQSPSLSLKFPRVPRDIMERIYGFFQAVYQRSGGEAVALIFYSPQRKAFAVAVPPQVISCRKRARGWQAEQRVAYGYRSRPKGYLKLGDAHSHADLPAFSSCADDEDEAGQDGLHIVLGRLDRSEPDVSVSFVANRTRFRIQREDALEDFSTPQPPPPAWLERVS